MSLKAALGLESGQMLALIGAGGKTTTLFRLAKELRDDGGKILVATTTKIFKPTKPHIDRLFLVEDVDSFRDEASRITEPRLSAPATLSTMKENFSVYLPAGWTNCSKVDNSIPFWSKRMAPHRGSSRCRQKSSPWCQTTLAS